MGESVAIRKSIPVALMSEAGKRKLFGASGEWESERSVWDCARLREWGRACAIKSLLTSPARVWRRLSGKMRKAPLMSAKELVPLRKNSPIQFPHHFFQTWQAKVFWSCSFVQLLQGINGPPFSLPSPSLFSCSLTVPHYSSSSFGAWDSFVFPPRRN